MATTRATPAHDIPAHPRMPDRPPEAPADEVGNVPMWEYVIGARLRGAGSDQK